MANATAVPAASGTLHRLAPGGRTLVQWSRFDGVPYWWMAHTRVGWLRYFLASSGTDAVRARLGRRDSPALVHRLLAARGGFAARKVRVPQLATYLDATHRVLFVGQNRQWPDADGGPHDRFFGDLVTRLGSEGFHAASTYPLTGGRHPWGNPTDGVATARARNGAPSGIPHLPADAVWSPAIDRHHARALRHFRRAASAIEAEWDQAADALPELRHADDHRILGDIVLHTFRTVLPICALLTEYGRAILARTRPHVVLLVNEYGFFERGLAQAAREAQIPSLAIQHGVLHADHPGYAFPPEVLQATFGTGTPLEAAPLPARIAVYGDAYRRILVDGLGWPDDTVRVTGHPKADHMRHLREATHDGGPTTVLWLTQGHGFPADENRRNEQAVLDAMRRLPDVRLVVKPHPNDRPDHLPASVPEDISMEMLSPQHDIHAAIRRADVAITKDSTTALEAMALDVPIVILNTTDQPDRIDYHIRGAALRATDGRSLAEAIETSLRNDPVADARSRYVHDHLGPLDGRSIERLAAEVTALVVDER